MTEVIRERHEATLERRVEFQPGYDRRNSDPFKNYGVHGMEIRFLLKGPKGVVQWLLHTDWLPETAAREYQSGTVASLYSWAASPAYLGYHAYVPQWAGQKPLTGNCPYLDGAPCYYDGTAVGAEPVYWRFVNEGEAAVWVVLQAEYDALVGPNASALSLGE